jgi:hypothetical protein
MKQSCVAGRRSKRPQSHNLKGALSASLNFERQNFQIWEWWIGKFRHTEIIDRNICAWIMWCDEETPQSLKEVGWASVQWAESRTRCEFGEKSTGNGRIHNWEIQIIPQFFANICEQPINAEFCECNHANWKTSIELSDLSSPQTCHINWSVLRYRRSIVWECMEWTCRFPVRSPWEGFRGPCLLTGNHRSIANEPRQLIFDI